MVQNRRGIQAGEEATVCYGPSFRRGYATVCAVPDVTADCPVPPPPAANASNAANAAEGNAASPAPDNGSDAADAP
mgnify:CR=1 FL=1